MNEVRIVGNDLIISVDEVTATIENAALIEDNKRLQSENENLRELVRISIEFCANGMCGIYDGCPLNAADGRCRFDDRARELGVDA